MHFLIFESSDWSHHGDLKLQPHALSVKEPGPKHPEEVPRPPLARGYDLPLPLLAVSNLVYSIGQETILNGATVSIEAGERVGLVGRNGTGKTTLLRLIVNDYTLDSGLVTLQKGRRAGYLKQDPDLDANETLRGEAESAFAELHRLHRRLDEVFEKMADPDHADDIEKLMREQTRLEQAMEAAGGYTVGHKIDAVLHGLGFADGQFGVKVKDLSGGQKGRLALAKLLLEEPDLLLLDEPTNHLDIAGREWLETFLTEEYRGAVLMVSHDRYLLDRVVGRIVEVEQGRLIDYPGNYEKFRELRAERRLAQHKAFERQQTKFKQEEAFIRKYKAGQRAKQARGRESRLDRERDASTIEKPLEVGSMKMSLPRAPRSGELVITMRGGSKSYDSAPVEGAKKTTNARKVLFDDLDLKIGRCERWGIIGPNGAGKTTLVRAALDEIKLNSGSVRLGSNVIVGYYRQMQEGFDPEMPLYHHLQLVVKKENPQAPMSEQIARDLLGAFLFSKSEQDKLMGELSGGERSRVMLAGLLASAKNLLVLDEPTNHLDIPSAERLEEVLRAKDKGGFEGTLILISHDRALIDATCDHLLVMDGQGGAEVFPGNYSAWHDFQTSRAAQARPKSAPIKRPKIHKPAPASNSGSKPRLSQDQKRIRRMDTAELEKAVEAGEKRIQEVDTQLSSQEVARDATRCKQLLEERGTVQGVLEAYEAEWLRRVELEGA